MNIILLSGGSGKRLWPLSNDIPFQAVLSKFSEPDAGNTNPWYSAFTGRSAEWIPKATVTVATSKSQVSSLHNQLGEEVSICVEPCRRDTFPAIVLATAYLQDVLGVSEKEPVVVCPVDPYVEDDYFEAVKKLSELAGQGESNLVLMGIEPTYPSEKYGYVIPEQKGALSRVATFKEKPDVRTAEEYISQGALWNGGVFAYRLGYVLSKAHELIDFVGYQDLYDNYRTLNKISFDYAVVEKESRIS